MGVWSRFGVVVACCTAVACSSASNEGTNEHAKEGNEIGEATEALSANVAAVDVTSISGQNAVGPFTSWQVLKNGFNEEHIGARSPAGDALVFTWSPQHDWQAQNVTALTGQSVASALTAWQVAWTDSGGAHNVEHIAGISQSNQAVLYWRNEVSSWSLVNVSQITGQAMAGALTSWVTPSHVEHLAGRAPDGHLISFSWTGATNWRAFDVTNATGFSIADTVTSWQVPDGSSNIEHLAGRAPNGDLLVFWSTGANDWHVVNVTARTGVTIASGVTNWRSYYGFETLEHLAATGTDGALYTFTWQPSWDWHANNVSHVAGGSASGAPVAYTMWNGDELQTTLAVRTPGGRVSTFASKPSVDWQRFEASTGATSAPEAWITPDGPYLVEHVAFEGPGQRAIVLWGRVQPLYSGPNVLTQHNDRGRTGATLVETKLNVSNVRPGTFGKLFSRSVDGQIYAQPLYVAGVDMGSRGVHNVVYVVTENNTVYAFDADDPNASAPLWQTPAGAFGQPFNIQSVWSGCVDMAPYAGISSTPVIELGTHTIYIEAKSYDGAYHHKLHALDMITGAERQNSPTEIGGSVPGIGPDSNPDTHMVTFNPLTQLQRPGLLLSQGVVYIAFGAHCDINPYHGWIFAYDATTFQQLGIYNTTPNRANVLNGNNFAGWGGVWASGNAPAADDEGRIFFETGNGAYDGATDFSDSFLRVGFSNQGFGRVDSYTPHEQESWRVNDVDLGVSGPMLVPGTGRLVGGSKAGKLYIVDRGNMGGYHSSDDSQLPQTPTQAANGHIHGSPVVWNGPDGPTVYIWSEADALKAFRMSGGVFSPQTPVSIGPEVIPQGKMPGAFLSISANGSAAGTGIVWANMPFDQNANWATVPGVLRAYNAQDLTQEIWNSRMNTARDDLGYFAKFSPPTIANGKVYEPTFSNQLVVYGILPCVPRTCGQMNACGSVSNGCGKIINCGGCQNPDAICKNHRCVIDPCDGLTGEDLICCRNPHLPRCRL